MRYQDYLKNISKRFSSRFDEIDPQWNFDLGHEFEIALASVISELLPDKYGVCRGFVTPENSDPKGDDIIIYDKLAAPMLRPPLNYEFTRKEYVPIEATYAYIEAKNTLELEDTNKKTYIHKAIDQVRAVKCLTREPRPLDKFIDGISVNGVKASRPEGFPQTFNPLYTILFARGVRINGNLEEDPYIIKRAIHGMNTGKNGPDLIILGKDLVLTPMHLTNGESGNSQSLVYETPFCIDDRHTLMAWVMSDVAYGFGLATLLHALQFIKLNEMPWLRILQEPLDKASAESVKRRSKK